MAKTQRLKVLLIVEQCNPTGFSVPLVGYRFYEQISQFADTTLVTHVRNQSALQTAHPDREIVYIAETKLIQGYYKIVERLSTFRGRRIWPLYNALLFPIYQAFNRAVFTLLGESIARGDFDIVHALTPMMPRYPVKAIKACKNTPFVLGPVNGGVPFPKGFKEVARQEFAYFNFLRSMGRYLIPGYRETYEQADYVFSGSAYTLDFIKDVFGVPDERVELLYENGLSPTFIQGDEPLLVTPKAAVLDKTLSASKGPLNLLFVGRLVPYKGADMLIDAVGRLKPSVRDNVRLSIVGDGSERANLEAQVRSLNLTEHINFIGWVQQGETLNYYRGADIFCFPSVREFGGAVVLEAMGNGLQCIVVNNGDIGEYVSAETGFSIDPHSRYFVVQQLTASIEQLAENPGLRQRMGREAIARAKSFAWDVKAQKVLSIYNHVLKLDDNVTANVDVAESLRTLVQA